MTRIDLHESSKLTFAEGAAPSTPSTGLVVIYAKTDGNLYQKDDAGTETGLAGGGGGNVATDTIWNAAGDLAVGTGADTAARLAIGATDGMALRRVAGAAAWEGYVGAKAYHNTTQGSLAASTVNPLSMNTEDFDTNTFHDTSTNNSRFTIPTNYGGLYLLIGHTVVDQAAGLYWRVDGTTLLTGQGDMAASFKNRVQQIILLAAGQYVELCEFHNSGTGTAGSATRHLATEGMIVRLG